MGRKNKVNWVYCPKCGEVEDAALLYCSHCKESLRGAAGLDPNEAKVKKRRERSIKRDTRRRAFQAKKAELFKKAPILEPLYYMLWTCLIIGIFVGLVQIFKISELAGFIIITVAFICFFIWYAPILIDNIDHFDPYIDNMDNLPSIYREKGKRDVHQYMFGLVIGGFMIIVCLLGLIGALME